MAETVLSIDGVTFPEQDITVFPVRSYAWGSPDGTRAQLRTLIVVRPVNDLSPVVASLLVSGEPRGAKLTSTDDAGDVRISLQLTGAQVRGYQVYGDSTDPVEQITLEASSVEMSSVTAFQIID
jgi:hypothetical protein